MRVVMIDDSVIVREALREALESDHDIEIVGEGESGADALPLVSSLQPDVVTMDLDMPGVSGIEAIERVMSAHPVPILVVTSLPAGPDTELAYLAIAAGAIDIAEKPMAWSDTAREILRRRVRAIGDVPVRATTYAPVWDNHDAGLRVLPAPQTGCQIVGVGSSACGTATVAALVGRLPETFPAAIALVQHLPGGFTDSFATYLRKRTTLPVCVVTDAVTIEPGTVYVPRDDHHLEAQDCTTLVATSAHPLEVHRPSATVLFETLAQHFGPRAAGVVLTGLGRDGADGILRLHQAGGLTLAQDEQSSVSFAMPRAAVESGGIQQVVPLTAIPGLLLAAAGASELVAQ